MGAIKLKRTFFLFSFLFSISIFLSVSYACTIYYRNDRWERNDTSCTNPQIWVYDWDHYSLNGNCACAIKYHPCRGFIPPLGPSCGEDMCYDYGRNNGCELGLTQYKGERAKISWDFFCMQEMDGLIYDPTDGPVNCSGVFETGRNNCDYPYSQLIQISPPRCESACGANETCDEKHLGEECNTGAPIKETCDSNCRCVALSYCTSDSDCRPGYVCDNPGQKGKCVKCNSAHVETQGITPDGLCEAQDSGVRLGSGSKGSYCTADYFCDEVTPGATIDATNLGQCSMGNNKTKDMCNSSCGRVDTNICDAECGADVRCNNTYINSRGNCPEGYSCDSNCQCAISSCITCPWVSGLSFLSLRVPIPDGNGGYLKYCCPDDKKCAGGSNSCGSLNCYADVLCNDKEEGEFTGSCDRGVRYLKDICDSNCQVIDSNVCCEVDSPDSRCAGATLKTQGNCPTGYLCNLTCGCEAETCGAYTGSYLDSVATPKQCSGYDYNYSSANQMRNYSGDFPNCDCNVFYDSWISVISVNEVMRGDTFVAQDQNITLMIAVKNTGKLPQLSWFVGTEFYNESDYTQPERNASKSSPIFVYFYGENKSYGCAPGGCEEIAGCSLVSESEIENGVFDPGETIRIKCWVTASYWSVSTGKGRILFWIHERDLTQDAGNDGNLGNDWWSDALSRSFRQGIDDPVQGGPADVRVLISVPPTPPACGNGNCEIGETCESCPQDCGVCPVESINVSTARGMVNISIPSIPAQNTTKVTIQETEEMPVFSFSITVRSYVRNIKIRIERIPREQVNLPSLDGLVYYYLSITGENIADSEITNILLGFEVEKSWLNSYNINQSTVALYRYTTAWNKLLTRRLYEDDTKVYFESESPGLSIFAIAGQEKQVVTPPSQCPTCPIPSNWSECINGTRTRINYVCSEETNYTCRAFTETETCEVEIARGFDVWGLMLPVSIVVIVLVSIITIYTFRGELLPKPRTIEAKTLAPKVLVCPKCNGIMERTFSGKILSTYKCRVCGHTETKIMRR